MASVFSVTFWGVRGMIPVPGAATVGVGGNTACVEVCCGPERIIFDAGTGIRGLGLNLKGQSGPFRLFLTHFHLDHVQGLPFFAPLTHRAAIVDVMGPAGGKAKLDELLGSHAVGRGASEKLQDLPARVEYRDCREGTTISCGEAVVTSAWTNHPGGGLAYRVDFGGHAVVYATDTEHYSCQDPKLARLAEQADLLIYDCTYTPEEYAGTTVSNARAGFGHSTFEHGATLARAASVRHLVLFHHHPDRTDAQVGVLEERCRRLFPESTAAREKMTVELL